MGGEGERGGEIRVSAGLRAGEAGLEMFGSRLRTPHLRLGRKIVFESL
jgi:hypothetical protein